MDAVNTPRTTRDALLIDLLGDVGRLHDQLKAIPQAFKENLAPSLGALTLASKEAQAAIHQLGAAEKASISNFAAAEKVALRDTLKAALREEAGQALANAALELAMSARTHQDAAKRETRHRWQWMAVALTGSLIAGALGFYGSHFLLGPLIGKQAALGRAVGTVWDSLDARTKERIQAARNNQ